MPDPKPRSAVVITIAGLPARWLAPWGCGSAQTPVINRLATRAVLFDQAFTLYGSAVEQFRSWQAERNWTNLRSSILLTDCGEAARTGEPCFADVIELQPTPPASPADSETATHLAGFFAGAAELLQTVPTQGSLVWIHSAGLELPWDAPAEWRLAAKGEDDPDPPAALGPPRLEWDAATEPDRDLITGWQQALSAQVRALDFALQPLVDALLDEPEDETPLVMLAGASGWGMGEHGQVGSSRPSRFHDEFLHVPLLACFPDADLELVRSLELTDADRAAAIVTAWLEGEPPPGPSCFPALPNHQRRLIWRQAGSARMIRTGAWKLIEGHEKAELYLKPDDRWEQNNVADRCPEIVDELRGWLDRLATRPMGLVTLEENEEPLSELLVRGVD